VGAEVAVAVVCDGVSMCYRGEIASYNTVRYVLGWASDYFSKNEFDTYNLPEAFDTLITKINQNLNEYSVSQKPKRLKAGYSPYSSCTLCCLITNGRRIAYFAIGDSSIFELRPFVVSEISKDKIGMHKNESGRLTSYVGGIEDNKIDIRFLESGFDDTAVYLLCTDGFRTQLSFHLEQDEDFRKFNQRLLNARTKADGVNVLQGMTEYVLEKGETDDITALVLKRA
jgi:serine/threonine protein phosphatase PrpC